MWSVPQSPGAAVRPGPRRLIATIFNKHNLPHAGPDVQVCSHPRAGFHPFHSLLESHTMIIGACTIRLHLPGVRSLKEKRGRLRPLLARLPKECNLAAAETGLQDVWQSAEIGLVTVSNDDA